MPLPRTAAAAASRKIKANKKKTTTTKRRKKLQQTYDNIKLLSLATPKARKQIVSHGNKEIVNSIGECCYNILKGHVHLSAKQKATLAAYKANLRSVGDKRTSLKRKKAIIQGGGFPLGAIISPVLSALGGLLFSGIGGGGGGRGGGGGGGGGSGQH